MKSKEQIKYFDEEWDDMESYLKSFLKNGDQEDLHRFRVQVKKINSFIFLADSDDHHTKLGKYFKPVKKVFKQAGIIRDAYNNLELAKKYNMQQDEFILAQQKLMEDAANDFKLAGNKYLKKLKSAHSEILEKIEPISNLHITLFYENQLNLIANKLADLKFDDSLHEARALVKILVYNYQLVQPVLETGFNEDYLQDVQTAVGDWHDNEVAIALFSGHPKHDKAAVSRLKKKHTKLKNNIVSLVTDFYEQATTVTELPVEQIS
ncbi:CHAD domain-containing protein [Mucilaginibacter sp.]